jgi:uncharacterized membrane protein YvbJ
LIKILEEYSEQNKKEIQRVRVKKDNNQEIIFDNYPIIVMPNDIEYIHYEAQKKQSHSKDNNDKKDGVLDKAKEKALGIKDSVVDTTKQLSNQQNNG